MQSIKGKNIMTQIKTNVDLEQEHVFNSVLHDLKVAVAVIKEAKLEDRFYELRAKELDLSSEAFPRVCDALVFDHVKEIIDSDASQAEQTERVQNVLLKRFEAEGQQ